MIRYSHWKCKECFKGAPRFAPRLKESGMRRPKDLICPICDTLHDSDTGKMTSEIDQETRDRIQKERDRLARENYWMPDDDIWSK